MRTLSKARPVGCGETLPRRGIAARTRDALHDQRVVRHGWQAGRRVLALAMALSLSGAPAIVSASLPATAHQCRCHHGPDEDCDCPRCHRALEAASEDATLPPCHRAAARARLARKAVPRAGLCVKSSCGSDEEGVRSPPQSEPMFLPVTHRTVRVGHANLLPSPQTRAGRDRDRPLTPPPRSSRT